MNISVLGSTLHTISSALQGPVMIVLLLFICVCIIEIGGILAEVFIERCVKSIDVSDFLKTIKGCDAKEILKNIDNSKIPKRHKKLFCTLLNHEEAVMPSGQALVRQLLASQEMYYERVLFVTDFIVRLSPMLGLMGTLIPLGPGLIALGQGDTKMLSESLLTAFDTTVTGLATGGIAFAISRLRKMWYEKDMSVLEALTEGILEEVNNRVEL